MAETKLVPQKPTAAFIGASWLVLLIGMLSFFVLLWNSTMELSDKGLYFTILMFGLFAVISIQKTIRDRAEDIKVTNLYYGVAWLSVLIPLALLVISLYHAEMSIYEKTSYALAMVVALFAVITVQKNVRDLAVFAEIEKDERPKPRVAQPGPGLAGAPVYGAPAQRTGSNPSNPVG